MRTYPLNPGAGLSSGAGLNPPPVPPQGPGYNPPPVPPWGAGYNPPPVPPWGAGQNPPPVPPWGTGQNPPPVPPVAGNNPPPAVSARTGAWQGVDPAWTFSSQDTLTARALWRTRSKINADAMPVLRMLPGGLAAPAIERWGGEHRARTIGADLAWRWRVAGNTLYRHDLVAGRLNGKSVIRLHTLPGEAYADQVDKVLRAAIEREERLPEILVQTSDLWTFFLAISGLDPARAPRTSELFDIAWTWAQGPVMALKHGLAGDGSAQDPSLRPFQRNSLVQPVIATPSHGSYPSGHASMAIFTSELLYRLLARPDAALDRLARRIAFNRVVAGVHYPVDSAAGAALGRQLAALFKAWATGSAVKADLEFNPLNAEQHELKEFETRVAPPKSTSRVERSELLGGQWQEAIAELRRLGL